MPAYTYLLVDFNGLMYIGKRTAKCCFEASHDPATDGYMGSYKDKTYKPIYKGIFKTFASAEGALKHEIHLHNFYDVAKSNLFVNRAKQTSTGFDTTGRAPANKGKPAHNRGKPGPIVTNETRLLISNALKGRVFSDEHKAKLSIANTGKQFSEERKHNISKAKGCEFTLVAPSGEKYAGKNVARFARANGLNANCIRYVLQGLQQSHKGWTKYATT